jgi:hypothetical protein
MRGFSFYIKIMGQELKPLIFDCEPCTYLFQLSKIFRNYVTFVLASFSDFLSVCFPFCFSCCSLSFYWKKRRLNRYFSVLFFTSRK